MKINVFHNCNIFVVYCIHGWYDIIYDIMYMMYGIVWYGNIWYHNVWYGIGMIWYGTIWYDVILGKHKLMSSDYKIWN